MPDSMQSNVPATVDVAIVGGGIGGLATAIALLSDGIDVHIFERSAVLKEVGGPLIVREGSVDLLEEWGLGAFHDFAVPVEFVDVLDINGNLLQSSSMDFQGTGSSHAVHRADLHDLMRDKIPAERLHLGMAVASVDNAQDIQSAVIEFTDGSVVAARLVVGADGIHSIVRKSVCDDEAVFQDAVVCRAIAPASALAEGMTNDRARMWVDGARRLLTVPMRAGSLVAIDAIVDASIADDAGMLEDLRPENQWNVEIPAETVLKRFADFDLDALRLIERRLTSVRADFIYDRSAIDSWANGRIVLVGDAAHPMAPRQGQGANQAILDGGALADGVRLFGLDDAAGALARYHELRHATATSFQDASRSTPQQLRGA